MEDVALAPLEAAALSPSFAEPESVAGHGSIAVARSAEQAEQLVLDLIAAHADSLLRTARRYSLCADDAQDAYQRGLEILMRHAARLDGDRAAGWLHTVVKHEALAINKARTRLVGGEEVDLDAMEIRTAPSPEDRVIAFEQVARSAEALQRLKPQEVRALWLKAMGNSYQEICDATGWTYTKVNRCLAEGRKAFLTRYAGIEEGEECRRWAPVLSAMVDGEASADQVLQLRPHLRNCAGCRAALRELRGSNAPLAALFPAGGLAFAGDRGHLDRGGDMLSRLWDALWGDLSDRAASAAFRAQSFARAILPGKSMAIFASVAAIAGGGLAVDEAARDTAAPRAALTVRSVSTAADRITRPKVAAPPQASPASRTTSKPKRRARVRKQKAPRVRRHAVTPASPARPAPRPAPRTVTSSVPTVTSPAVSRPSATPAPRVPAATGGAPASAAPSSGTSGEFGPEGH